ncbi:MAG: polyprenyl diphosphate synthase [Candidatus Woesearchaeota archaeon]|nr:polyprenyl diphosphate synthase [Candidatus Woesearchaeota archaeon]
MKPTLNNVPRHIGIILDGNRRFAQRLMLKPWKGHEWGAKKLEHLFEWCKEYGVKELTLYAFSVENFDRPKEEFAYLMDLFRKEFDRVIEDPDLSKKKVRFNMIGRIWMFPKDLQERMHKLMELTKDYNDYIVNFAMAYGGRAEVIDATKKIAEQVKKNKIKVEDINEQVFSENLYMQDEPDLIIRTSESRLSGFLPWQSTYSEIIFLPDTLWPEFEKKDFIACINEFQKRQRRYGH